MEQNQRITGGGFPAMTGGGGVGEGGGGCQQRIDGGAAGAKEVSEAVVLTLAVVMVAPALEAATPVAILVVSTTMSR
ncbi:hypothetical protein L1987_77160 [Smallanthus sonchifolius]|uniref:Uncharacterized protein n=1 Tax=Smallanthus sonchifolius TaxID=185202 RepID=A0ACB8Z9C7_9ASTR|nr:hypothetical protein L1987_77160 [Smallanthus sonchifolius]